MTQSKKRIIGRRIEAGVFVPILQELDPPWVDWRSPYTVFPIALITLMIFVFTLYGANHYSVSTANGKTLFVENTEGSKGFYTLDGLLIFKDRPVTTYNGEW